MAKIPAIISEETAIHIPEANKLPNGFEIEDAPYVLEIENMKFTKKGLLLSDVEKILKLFCSPNFFLLPELPKKEDLPPLNFAFFIFSPVNAWSGGLQEYCYQYPYEENFNAFKRVISDLNNDGRDAKDLWCSRIQNTEEIEIVGGKMEIEGLQDGLKTISQNNKKEVWSQPNPTDVSRVQLQDKRPYCEVKGKLGFLKFNKQIAGVKIGSASAQTLQIITMPYRTFRNSEDD